MSSVRPSSNIPADTKILKSFLYLFIMDIVELTRINFSEYEKREPNFAEPFLEAFIAAFKERSDGLLSHELIKKINKISLSHLPNNSKNVAGEYKVEAGFYSCAMKNMLKNNDPNDPLIAPSYSATDAGIGEFIGYWLINNKQDTHVLEFVHQVLGENRVVGVMRHKGNVVFGVVNYGKAKFELFDKQKHMPLILNLAHNTEYAMRIGCHMSRDDALVQSVVHNTMDQIINDHNKAIKLAKTDDDKLKVICKALQLTDQLHPVIDGNIRTCVVLLNKLLKDNGLRLSLLLNPNRLDCCTLDEVVNMVKVGQDIFESLMSHTNPDEFLINIEGEKFGKVNYIRCAPFNFKNEALVDQFIEMVINAPELLLKKMSKGQLLFPLKKQGDVNVANADEEDLISKLESETPNVSYCSIL